MFKKILFFILILCVPALAQVDVTRDELPNTNSADSTAVLNNVLRQNQNAINTVGGYFNSNGYLGPANGGTGNNISAFPNGSVLIYDGGNVGIGTFSQGTSGQILESQGVGVAPTWETLQINDVDVITTVGTTVWTAPAGVYSVWVTLQAGGASGGANSGGARGGGGAGAFLTGAFYPVIPGNSYNVVVGAGGIAVSGNNNGNAGGNSSFDTNLVANGGSPNIGTTGGIGGAVNSASNMNASTVTAGARGFSFGSQIAGGNGGNTSGGSCGGGGGTIFGAGASGGASPNNATNYGTGGSGAITNGTSGSGFQGIVYIQH